MKDIRKFNKNWSASGVTTSSGFSFTYNSWNLNPLGDDFLEFDSSVFHLGSSVFINEKYHLIYDLKHIDLSLWETDLSPENYHYFQYMSFPPSVYTSMSYMSIPQNSSTISNTIFNSNFRDKFLNEFHTKMASQKLTCISDNSSKIISKTSYEYLKNICNIKYNLSVFSNHTQGFEGFIDNHTYITCTYDVKTEQYLLTSFFSHNETIYKAIINNLEFLLPEAKISWVVGVSQNGLDIEELPVEKPKPIFNSFYPWLNGCNIKDFLDNYLESSESILLFYGVPGTGKSNLLKHFLHEYNISALITYQDNIRDLDQMFSHFLKGDDKVLIIEDADEFLTKRESGNTSMKRLLNITDGLTSNKDKKVIFTTNLTNTNNIDSALLREGRCYGAFNFSSLNKEESLLVARDLEIDTSSLTKDKYTLAEMFAIKNNKIKLIKSKQTETFGFSK